MSLDPNYWPELASDYDRAAVQQFGRIVSRDALCLAMSVAEHETNNGRAWPGTNNFGAVQLRTLTVQEVTAFQAGTLKAGDYTPNRDGVLHVDTHPTPSGPQPYPVWFAAFDSRVNGIAFFLKKLWSLSDAVAESQGCTTNELALRMYLHYYFEGAHPGARGWGKRSVPLTPPEAANVSDYAAAITKCLTTITSALGGWETAQQPTVNDPEAVTAVDVVTTAGQPDEPHVA